VDASVIAEAPRLAPHLAGIRDRLSRALGIERDAVSVKATTNDGLGIVGAGEAIATLATVIVEKSAP
jgi:2-C-methyl-D-erythritol 2,4-cyclodiphosphate synthase